jgi:hypothetical protein
MRRPPLRVPLCVDGFQTAPAIFFLGREQRVVDSIVSAQRE